MTLNKSASSKQGRSYGSEISSQSVRPNSHTSDSGKSNQAARMAQALGSQRSWADTYAPHTPAGSVGTPTASTVDDNEREHLIQRPDPDDPPPAYDGPPQISELAGEPVPDNRSMQQNYNVRPYHDDESEDSSHASHEHSPSLGQVEAQHSPVRCGRRHRRELCSKDRAQRRRRVRLCFLLLAFILICASMVLPQSIPALKEVRLSFYTMHDTY